MGQDGGAADEAQYPRGRVDSFSAAFDQFTGEDGYDRGLRMSGSTREFYLQTLEEKNRQSQHRAAHAHQLQTPEQLFGNQPP